MEWPNYVLTLQNSCGQQFCLSGVRPHNIETVVELSSAKVACKELQLSFVGWIAPVKYSNAAQANCASSDAGAMQNTQTEYVSYKQGHHCRILAASLK